jgi:CHASE3 domain sensor protein
MENELLLLQIMAVFTGVAAFALVMQMVFLFRINQTAKQLKERANTFMDRWEPVAETSQKMLEDIRKQSGDILTKINDLAESTKDAMDKADTILGDISTSTDREILRASRRGKRGARPRVKRRNR